MRKCLAAREVGRYSYICHNDEHSNQNLKSSLRAIKTNLMGALCDETILGNQDCFGFDRINTDENSNYHALP
jgi:hypothetical protein